MAISGGGIFVHYPAIRAECYLLLLIFAIIEGHSGQAIGLVELGNHILLFRLEQHVRRYDGYYGTISLGFQERAQAGHLPGNPSSSVQGQPPLLKLEVVGFARGDTTRVFKVVYPVHAYDCWWASLIGHSP